MFYLSLYVLSLLSLLNQSSQVDLPKTKQELQVEWDSQVEKIQKKYNTEKRNAEQAIDIIEYISDYFLLQIAAEQSGIAIPDKDAFVDVIKGITVNSPDLEYRKRGAQIFALIDKGIKNNVLSREGVLYNAGLPETLAIWELKEDPTILERLKKNILDEKSGKSELIAIKMFATGLNKLRKKRDEELARKAEEDKNRKMEEERVAEIKRKEEVRIAAQKKLQEMENSRAAGERKKLEDARIAALNELKLAETPKKLKEMETSISEMRMKIEENNKRILDLDKKIAATEKAFKDDKWRLPRVPAALQPQVKDRLAKHQDNYDEYKKNIDDLKKENKELPAMIEQSEKKLEDEKNKYEKELKEKGK